MEFILVGGASFVLGHWFTVWIHRRYLSGPVFEAEVRKQLRTAFEAGMAVAADHVTMSGQEALAGEIRQVMSYISSGADAK